MFSKGTIFALLVIILNLTKIFTTEADGDLKDNLSINQNLVTIESIEYDDNEPFLSLEVLVNKLLKVKTNKYDYHLKPKRGHIWKRMIESTENK